MSNLSLAAVVADLRSGIDVDRLDLADRIERLDAEMRKEREQLRAFAADVLEEFWEGGMDGCDLQDIGEKHGLLVKTEIAERCDDGEGGCSCAEAGADFPTDCYRFAPVLAAQSSAKGVE